MSRDAFFPRVSAPVFANFKQGEQCRGGEILTVSKRRKSQELLELLLSESLVHLLTAFEIFHRVDVKLVGNRMLLCFCRGKEGVKK